MMSRATLSIVLIVSCAHAMVHIYEQSLPSVEQRIANDFFPSNPAQGKEFTGQLANVWRLMWGVGGVLAGWLVDRCGSRRMLALYLLGCAAAAALSASSVTRSELYTAMLLSGAFAAIYHPAGLTLISHETNPQNRARAQGIHGVFGSLGIGLAPLAVGIMFHLAFTWRQVYGVLVVPGVLLGLVFVAQSIRRPDVTGTPQSHSDDRERVDWQSFCVLTLVASAQGFTYSAVTSFLPRYIHGGLNTVMPAASDSLSNYLTAAVLFIGCFGQYFAGRIGRSTALESQLIWITSGSAPFLAWMAVAGGWGRPIAAACWTLVHFMHQPIYNTLIAKYTPRHQRGMFYGISFAMGQGVGSFGAGFAGKFQSDALVYGVQAIIAGLGGLAGVVLWLRNRQRTNGYSANGR
jgi:FSR family fosmidomycin resistance protein-like MFS transporter